MNKKSQKKKNWKQELFDVQMIYRNALFIFLLVVLGLFYIYNNHRAEKKLRKIQTLEQDIEKAKWKYWEAKSDIMYEGIQSQTELRVQDLGLKSGEGSLRIIYNDVNELTQE